jgi:TPP-dependent trihydroxycyclohexane-1,2-dione (THcHDO) dehydratase
VPYFEGLSDVLQQKNTPKMQNFALNKPFERISRLFDRRFLPKLLKNALIAMTLAVAGVKK